MKLQGWLMMLTAMAMFLSLLGLPTGLTPVLDGLGISINSTTSEVITADLENSNLWNKIFGSGTGILIIVGGAAIITIGLFARGYDPSLIILPFIVFVAYLFISTFWGITSYVSTLNQSWLTSIIALIFTALAVGFSVSLVDYFAGR